MSSVKNALDYLNWEMEKKEKRTVLNFEEFLEIVKLEPQRSLRDIFQLFHDMVKNYVGEGKDEYPDDPESIGFVQYDCSKLFVEKMDNPFFADRLFANRFIRHVENLRQGSQQNRIYIFEGPHGCGKSTFLNNLLRKFEEYTNSKEGRHFEIFWMIDENLFQSKNGVACADSHFQKIEIPCPSHDHPILLIPKSYRIEFLDNLINGKGVTEIKYKISSEKEYEWIFKDEVCTICKSLFWALFDKLDSFDKVLEMVKVRPYKFNRRLGEGIGVFNPGDKTVKEFVLGDDNIQKKLDQIFGTNFVKYVFSRQAKTNNGIYVLMDIKGDNKERLLDLHNVISEGVHKVGDIEEKINSLFIALMNPEDKQDIQGEKAESFQERIQYIKVPYVLEVSTEVKIYRSIFGEHIDLHFLPRVLENFARVIISSRMNAECKPFEEWIKDIKKYERYCDEKGLLLRMAIYSGIIPPWLSEEDKKKFTAPIRRKLIAEAEKEGEEGFSGRMSIKLFGDFFSRYGSRPNLINMANLVDFFKHKIDRECRDEHIPKKFIDSLVGWYNYTVLSEVKESLYFYSKEQISEDILNFLCAVNQELGDKVKCRFTGKDIEVTVEFLKMVGSYLTGEQMDDKSAMAYAQEIQQRYVMVMAQELQGPGGKSITETDLYSELFTAYVKNLKEKTLQPFLKNESFRDAVKSFKTAEFGTFDTRTREYVDYMINNLMNKFGYNEQGAKEIFLHVVDNKLPEKFS